MRFIVTIPDSYPAERDYILSVMLKEFLGLDFVIHRNGESGVRISDKDNERCLLIPDSLFATPKEQWMTIESLPKQPLQVWDLSSIDFITDTDLHPVPIIYGPSNARNDDGKFNKKELWIPIDIFGSCFFMLTRYEEMIELERDIHDRFPSRKTLAHREGFMERPIVNEYLNILWECLKYLWPGIKRKKREYRLLLSHDVDEIFSVVEKPLKQVIRKIGGDIIIRRDLLLASRSFRAAWKGLADEDPVNTFDLIMNESEKYGITSTFNFMVDIGDCKYDGRYQITHPWARHCLRRIKERGHIIGFHPTYDSYLNVEKLKSEFSVLKRVAEEEGIYQEEWGGRQHYLRWKNPSTWQHWEEAGLNYDSTLGFPDCIGFRTGCCYDYPVFNLKTKKMLSVREKTLIVMEVSTTNRNGTVGKQSQDQIVALNQSCYKHSGDFTILWHNGNLVSREQKKSYISLLNLLRGTVDDYSRSQ